MKKFIIIFSIFLFISFNMLITPSMAQPTILREGLYKMKDLNLSENTIHTIQNNSLTESAFVVIFDANQIVQEVIKLNPQSEKYPLPAIQTGYEIVIVGNGEITIS